MADRLANTILVVDDTEAGRYAVVRLLQRAGYTVWEAGTGAEALRRIADKPDLVILDVNLPDINGYEVCRHIKTDPDTASILVLHLSASMVESENRSVGLEGGADGYLVHPVEPRELLANIQALFRVRRAERLAREQRELLQVTLSSIGDAVIATDTQGLVTFLNAVAQSLTGWTQDEAVGRPLSQVFRIINEETRSPGENPADKVLRQGTVVGMGNHTVLIAKDGTERPIDDSAAPIKDAEGKTIGVVMVFRDVTERRRSENEKTRLYEALRQTDRRKDEFLAMLAHELRNPLAPIWNAVQVLRMKGADNPDTRWATDVMNRQVQQLTRLVDDLLDVARINRGKINLQKEPLDLAVVVARAVETSRPVIDGRRHRFELSMPQEPVYVQADPVRLAQVLWNLLVNAAKYTPEGGRIRLAVEKGVDTAVVRVQDTGVGITAEMLSKVFDLFTQVDRNLDRAEGGLGIGLTLVRQLTEMHGGKVEAFSEGPGRGSEFVVRLPLCTEAVAAPQGPGGLTQVAAGRGRRILVVDDNRDAAESLATLLRLFGHEVRTAYDGQQALVVAGAHRPELVLLDIGLPGLTGYEVAQQIRAKPELAQTAVVALTGFGGEDDRRQSQAAGFDAHLVKPVDLAALQALLAQGALPARPGPG